MIYPDPLLSSPFVEHFGWMLVHAVWQGALVAALLAGILRLLRHHAPSVRYVVSCAALVVFVALPVSTSLVLHAPTAGPASVDSAAPPVETEAQIAALLTATSSSAEPAGAWTEVATWTEAAAGVVRPWLPWIVAGWALGLLLAAGRLAGGAWHVRRLRRDSTSAPEPWPDRLSRLADRLGIRASVPLRVSERIDGPMVVGWLRPMVLVPAGMLTGLPPSQVEALLVHELGHIRRHDVLVGWIQAVVEALLFFHPAAWWISGRIRRERELCCDDVAVETGAETLTYARALTAVAEQQVRPSLALSASDGPLLQRVRRLLTPEPATTDGWRQRVSLGAAVVLLAALPLLVAACASQQGTATPASEEGEPAMVTQSEESETGSVAVPGDDDETVFRIERDSGDVEEYRMIVSGDSAEVAVRMAPQHRRSGEIRVYGDSVWSFVIPRGEDNARHGTLLREDDAGNVVIRLQRDSLGPNLLADTLLARFRALREWREDWEEDWTPERREELERRLDRWSEEHADSLEQRAEKWAEQFQEWHEEHADSLEHRAEDWAERFGRWAEEFEHEWRFDDNAEWDRRMRRFERHADSARAHAERLRERLASEHWEHELRRLREQAERLREQAERLEERAREMEERLPPDSLR
jgi:beta-lactamase regulating signal transducer with metallopeptidase domain